MNEVSNEIRENDDPINDDVPKQMSVESNQFIETKRRNG